MRLYSFFSFVFLVSLVNPHAECFNILVYSPVFGGSHSNFMGNIADALTEAGHNVTFLVPIADVTRKNDVGVKLTKNVVVVEREDAQKVEEQHLNMDEILKPLWTIQNRPNDFATCFEFFINMMTTSCQEFTSNKKVFEELSKQKFDVAIAEPISVCGLGYFQALGINKTIIASSVTQYEGVVRNTGEPVDMSYVPVHGAYFDEKMSIWQRYTNWAAEHVMAGNLEMMFDMEMQRYREHLGVELPDWRELLPAASLFFTNSNPYLDFPRPVIQKTVPIGGISVNMNKIRGSRLDEQWEEMLSRRPLNMLISFGSMVKSSTMPIEWKMNILKVIRSEPNVTFIWKYESEDVSFAEGVPNVILKPWLPQTALLNHPRVTAFLTHGGLGSTNELAYLGKPAVMVPIFGDQGRNAPMLARHRGAIVLQKFELEEVEKIRDCVRRVLFDESFTKNAQHLSRLLNSAPFSPKELVVQHTEFVAEFGPLTQLDPYIRKLNWFQKNFIDIYLLMLLCYSPFVLLPLFIAHKLLRRSL